MADDSALRDSLVTVASRVNRYLLKGKHELLRIKKEATAEEIEGQIREALAPVLKEGLADVNMEEPDLQIVWDWMERVGLMEVKPPEGEVLPDPEAEYEDLEEIEVADAPEPIPEAPQETIVDPKVATLVGASEPVDEEIDVPVAPPRAYQPETVEAAFLSVPEALGDNGKLIKPPDNAMEITTRVTIPGTTSAADAAALREAARHVDRALSSIVDVIAQALSGVRTEPDDHTTETVRIAALEAKAVEAVKQRMKDGDLRSDTSKIAHIIENRYQFSLRGEEKGLEDKSGTALVGIICRGARRAVRAAQG